MRGAARKSEPPVKILTHAAPAGASRMDFVSYEDAADAILRAVESGAYNGQRFCAVTPSL